MLVYSFNYENKKQEQRCAFAPVSESVNDLFNLRL